MKKMNKTLAIAIAAAMVSPSAFAAQDTSGMQFTSASEGFYASIRTRLDFSGLGDANASIDDNSSRIGVRGSNDLGGGLSGFYQWEAELKLNDNDGPGIDRARLGHVGLRGSFGEIVVGGFWANEYNWTHGGTDVANNYSGWTTYNDQRHARSNQGIQYSTPDLNGFQAAVLVQVGDDRTVDAVEEGDGRGVMINSTNDDIVAIPAASRANGTLIAARSDNDIDVWNIAAKYEIQGFSVGAAYNNQPDGLNQYDVENDVVGYDDKTAWTIKSGYAQDNWYVNAWYGEDNDSDNNREGTEDREFFSIAAGVSVDKVNLYIVHDAVEQNYGGTMSDIGDYGDSAFTTLGVQYSLGSNSRVWIEYFAQDVDSDPSQEDIVSVGLRHDF